MTYPPPQVERTVAVSLVGPTEGAFLDFAPDTVAQGTGTFTQEHRFPT